MIVSSGISCGSLELDALAGMTDREPRGLPGLTNEIMAGGATEYLKMTSQGPRIVKLESN